MIIFKPPTYKNPKKSADNGEAAPYAEHPHYVSYELNEDGKPKFEIFYEDREYHVGNTEIYTDYNQRSKLL